MYSKIFEDMEAGEAVSILAIAHVFYTDRMRTGGSISWTNKNPGNIVRSSEAESYGAYPGKYNYLFAIFPSEEAGFQAIRKFLRHPNRRTKTILEMMKIYAPSGHGANTPEKYAQAIVDALGGGVTTSTRIEDLSDGQITKFAEKIRQVEGWTTGLDFDMDDLPGYMREWLEKHPTPAERAAADQPFAKVGAPKAEGIKNIQRHLNDFGWTPALVVDGIFGAKTDAAVRHFQQRNGLAADGIVGNKTWRKLTGV
ncbi:peptidoglycan-binding protein [Streptomyces sp. NPDC058685]|uniref:peptidoglycan-binding protein n=1 Tax=Streptomyces sp. NPDC058685 TaxID=3346598 RepID=UPI003652B225